MTDVDQRLKEPRATTHRSHALTEVPSPNRKALCVGPTVFEETLRELLLHSGGSKVSDLDVCFCSKHLYTY